MTLKPCPFCGKAPELSNTGKFAHCKDCLLLEWLPIDLWNTRAPDAEITEALRANIKFLESILPACEDDDTEESVKAAITRANEVLKG